jgi:hypothetical protein
MKFLNEKKDQSNRIILPNQDGVASLDIRRVKKELAGESGAPEMCGHLPSAVVPKIVEQLKKMISDVEKGEVSTICVLAIMPQADGLEAGSAFFTGPIDEMDRLDELFHAGLIERLEEAPPDDEAG